MSDLFVGRDRELERGAELFCAVTEGVEAVYGIEGAAGMGKTLLVQRLAAVGRAKGLLVLNGSFVDGQDLPPLWPWRRIVTKAARFAERDPQLPAFQDVVSRHSELLSNIGSSWAETGGLTDVDSEHRKYRIYQWIEAFLHDLAGRIPLLIVVEDLHNGDDLSLHLLSFLIDSLEYEPVGVLLSWRPGEGRGAERIEALKKEIRYIQHAEIAALTPFNEREIRLLLAEISGKRGAIPNQREEGIAEVMAWTGGVPLRVLLYGKTLAAEPDDASGDPRSLSALFWRGIRAGISVEARALVESLALLGNAFTDREITALLPVEADKVAIVDELLSAGLIHRGEEPSVYHFFHDEFRLSVLDAIEPSRRETLVEATAAAIDRLEGEGERRTRLLKELYLSSGASRFAEQALRYTVAAVEQGRAHNAWREVISDLERLLERYRDAMDPERVREFQHVLCVAYHHTYRDPFHMAEAVELWRYFQDHDELEKAIELFCNFDFYISIDEIPDFHERVERLLGCIDSDDPRRCAVLIKYGLSLAATAEKPGAIIEVLEDARALAVRNGDVTSEVVARGFLADIDANTRAFERAVSTVDELLRVHKARIPPSFLGRALFAKMWALLGLGRNSEVRSMLEEIRELSNLTGDPFLKRNLRRQIERVNLRAGNWDRIALRDLEPSTGYFYEQLPAITAAYLTGDAAAADHYVRRMMSTAASWGLSRRTIHWLYVCWFVGLRAYIYDDRMWVDECAEKVSELALLTPRPLSSLGDFPVAAARMSRIHKWSEAEIQSYYAELLENDKYFYEEEEYTTSAAKALLKVFCGDREAAARHFEEAVAFCDKYEEKPWRAYYLFELALLTRDADSSRAERLAAEASSEARRLDLKPLLGRIEAQWGSIPELSSTLPVEADEGGAREERLSAVTRREQEILECLVEGLTDKEIAASLNISPYTVGNHLRNIYGKIGAANRGEAAHWALSKGLVLVDRV